MLLACNSLTAQLVNFDLLAVVTHTMALGPCGGYMAWV